MILPNFTFSRKNIIFLLFLAIISKIAYSNELEKQKEALNIIADFSDRLCSNIPLSGSREAIELTGEAKAELDELLKKIASLGIQGAAQYQKNQWNGVIHQDLAEILATNMDCKLKVLDVLKDKIALNDIYDTSSTIELRANAGYFASNKYKVADILADFGEGNMIVENSRGIALTSAFSKPTTFVLKGFSISKAVEFKVNLDLGGFANKITLWNDNSEILSVKFQNSQITFGDYTRGYREAGWQGGDAPNDVKVTIDANNIAKLFINDNFFGIQKASCTVCNKLTVEGIKRNEDYLYEISVNSLK